MVKEFKKSIGYICPYCSSITVSDINLFDFSGSDTISFPCTGNCPDQCITVTPKKDKYTISVNCPMCDDPHIFNVKKITFWQNRFFVLHCPETGIGILFVGNRDEVKSEIEAQEEMFVKMNEEYAISDELNLIFDTVERINELAKDGGVSCSCGSTALSIEIDNEKITLRCRTCGRIKDIPANEETLNMLLNTSTIVLD